MRKAKLLAFMLLGLLLSVTLPVLTLGQSAPVSMMSPPTPTPVGMTSATPTPTPTVGEDDDDEDFLEFFEGFFGGLFGGDGDGFHHHHDFDGRDRHDH